MAEQNKAGEDTGPEHEALSVPIPAWAALGSTVALGAFVYWWVHVHQGSSEFWARAGDAVAPFAALLSAGAVFAALWSVALQRRELAAQRAELRLQREELALNREVMKEQARHAEESAAAQRALTDAQTRLAVAQEQANEWARFMSKRSVSTEITQRWSNIATLQNALTSIEIASTGAFERASLTGQLEVIAKALHREIEAIRKLGGGV